MPNTPADQVPSAVRVKGFVLGANHRTPPLDDAQWEAVKPILQTLRQAPKISVKNIIQHMAEEHNFQATKDQYNKKFRDWEWAKRTTKGKPVVTQQDSPPDPAAAADATPLSQRRQVVQACSRNRADREPREELGRVTRPAPMDMPIVERAFSHGGQKRHRATISRNTPIATTPSSDTVHSPTRSSSSRSHSQGLGPTTPPSLISDTETTCSRSHKKARIDGHYESIWSRDVEHGNMIQGPDHDVMMSGAMFNEDGDIDEADQLCAWVPGINTPPPPQVASPAPFHSSRKAMLDLFMDSGDDVVALRLMNRADSGSRILWESELMDVDEE